MKIHLSPDDVRKACILFVRMTHYRGKPSPQFDDVEFKIYLGNLDNARLDKAIVEIIEEKDEQ